MTTPTGPTLSPMIRFPRFTDLGDLNSLSIVIQDLSLIYDVAAIAVLPGYGRIRMPEIRFGPRRWSPLRPEDRLKVRGISLGSPLEIIFDVTGFATTVGGIAIAVNRVLVAVKTWQDVLAAGVDHDQREQALSENREMAPIRLRQAQLSNDLLEQQVRRARAEADVVEAARAEILQLRHPQDGEVSVGTSETRPSIASALTSADFAELLDEPIRRLLGYSGGELEVAGDEREGPDHS
jgi:hypothetical protein